MCKTESERLFTLERALLCCDCSWLWVFMFKYRLKEEKTSQKWKGVGSYRCHFFLAGKEVVVGQVHHVHARDNGQWFRKVIAVWEIQVEHVTDLGVLWIVNKTEISITVACIVKSVDTNNAIAHERSVCRSDTWEPLGHWRQANLKTRPGQHLQALTDWHTY